MASLLGNNYLPTEYQSFIHMSRYSRWLEEEGRRETWTETVSRLIVYFKNHIDVHYKGVLKNKEWTELEEAILSLQVMPSMRALMTSGGALDRENIAGYNCSYIPIDSPKAFDEVLYILMNGTGVGFSVERQYADKLPTIPDQKFEYTDDMVNIVNGNNEVTYDGNVPGYELHDGWTSMDDIEKLVKNRYVDEQSKSMFQTIIQDQQQLASSFQPGENAEFNLQKVYSDVKTKIVEMGDTRSLATDRIFGNRVFKDDLMTAIESGTYADFGFDKNKIKELFSKKAIF